MERKGQIQEGIRQGGRERRMIPPRTEVLAQLGLEWAARLAPPLVVPIPAARQKEAQRRGKLGKGDGRLPVQPCPTLQAPSGALREGL